MKLDELIFKQFPFYYNLNFSFETIYFFPVINSHILIELCENDNVIWIIFLEPHEVDGTLNIIAQRLIHTYSNRLFSKQSRHFHFGFYFDFLFHFVTQSFFMNDYFSTCHHHRFRTTWQWCIAREKL